MEHELKTIEKIPGNVELAEYLKKKVIPIKFCYPNEGGDRWHELRKNSEYSLGKRELIAFRGGLKKIKEYIGGSQLRIIHLGPGDGIELPLLYGKEGFSSDTEYVGIDISKQMISNTIRLNKLILKKVPSLWYLADIETEGNLKDILSNLNEKTKKENLILLTNQGVLISNPKTLTIISNSMKKGDYLFITLEGDDPTRRDEVLATYNLEEVRNILRVGLKRAGIKKGKFLPAIFNEKLNQAEVYFKEENGEKILCLTSYKPNSKEQIKEKLEKNNLNALFIDYFPEAHSYAILCRRE